jgi:hypothetical protein
MQTTWITPQWLIDLIGVSDLDPCGYYGPDGNPIVQTARNYIVFPEDGLKAHWDGSVYCNPPYDDNARWLRKCVDYHRVTGNDVIILIFAKTETDYFQNTAHEASAINFIRRRVKFLTAEGRIQGSPTHASVLIALGRGAAKRIDRVPGWICMMDENMTDEHGAADSVETFGIPKCQTLMR